MCIKIKENITEKRNTRNKSATKTQIFRFCCRCVRMTLIEDKKCFFCKELFIVEGIRPLSYFE